MNDNLQQFLKKHPRWEHTDNSLTAIISFNNYSAVQKFVREAMEICDQQQHHATFIVEYDQVKITTTTHDKRGVVTKKDINLANAIADLA